MGGSSKDQDTSSSGLMPLPSPRLTLRARVGAAGDSGVVAPSLLEGQASCSRGTRWRSGSCWTSR
eukprot:15050112-Alexandrium_andersonii.AAC.1